MKNLQFRLKTLHIRSETLYFNKEYPQTGSQPISQI